MKNLIILTTTRVNKLKAHNTLYLKNMVVSLLEVGFADDFAHFVVEI